MVVLLVRCSWSMYRTEENSEHSHTDFGYFPLITVMVPISNLNVVVLDIHDFPAFDCLTSEVYLFH